MNKETLLKFMHSAGFEWICGIDYYNSTEWVASKLLDTGELWWRDMAVEGSGFERLFKGAIRQACQEKE